MTLPDRPHRAKYRRIYKYRLEEDVTFQTDVRGYTAAVNGNWVRLYPDGTVTLKAGYSWDGCTLVPDVPGTEEPSAVHDGLYQLTKLGLIPKKYVRAPADRTFRVMMQENNVPAPVCWIYWAGVRSGGWAFC